MTETAATAVFAPTGRPVARFVTAIAVISALLIGLWWSAVFNPRFEITVPAWDATAGAGRAVVAVHNLGPTALRVQVVDVNDRFVHLTAPSPIVTVGPRHTQRVTVRYATDCAAYNAAKNTPRGEAAPALRLRVRTRAPAGLVRQSQWPHGRELDLGAACGDARS